MNPHRLRANIILIIVAIIWGAAGPVIKFTLSGIDPLPFLIYRFAIASIFSIGFFAFKISKGKKFKRLRANFSLAVIYGLLAAPLALGILFLALDKTTVLDMTLIGVFGPMLTITGSALFFHDHITKKEKFGIAIVLFGVILNAFAPIFKSASGLRFSGNLLLLLFLLADSGSVLIAKKCVRLKIKSANLTNLAFIIGFLTVIPLGLVKYGATDLVSTITSLPLKYHLGVWYMALVSGTIAYFLFVKAQKTIEVSEAILFNYLQPLFTIPLAIFWLGEKISSSFLVGGLFIAVGIIIAEYKKSAKI